MRALDIVILNTPRGGLIKILWSSYGLSIFSSKAGSRHAEGTRAVPGGSSSVCIGELWPDIDKLDKAGPEGTSVIAPWSPRGDPASHCHPDLIGSKRMRGDASRVVGRVSFDEALSPSFAPPKGWGGGSAKSNTARILSDAPWAISPCMRRSFVDRQYSPSTSMDRSEWEIILEYLICMGYIVKKELVSNAED
jgi:hypothetical protein